jgi:hypothetical protein
MSITANHGGGCAPPDHASHRKANQWPTAVRPPLTRVRCSVLADSYRICPVKALEHAPVTAPANESSLAESALPKGECCWSAWGGAGTCGHYPHGGSSGLCNTDWSKKCSENAECPKTPVPSPSPSPSPSAPLTEACFQAHTLAFASNQTEVRFRDGKSITIPATRTTIGTHPAGSQWTKNPIPETAEFFAPPFDGGAGSHWPFSLVDKVELPSSLTPGAYVVSWRWDCELTSQVWTNCGDVTITG